MNRHDEDEEAALQCAVSALHQSTTAVQGLEPVKLRAMCTQVISAWLRGRAELSAQQGTVGATCLDEAEGRVPRLEPFIAETLGSVAKLELPWSLPLNQWDKEDAVRLISASVAQAMLMEHLTLQAIPFPENPDGRL